MPLGPGESHFDALTPFKKSVILDSTIFEGNLNSVGRDFSRREEVRADKSISLRVVLAYSRKDGKFEERPGFDFGQGEKRKGLFPVPDECPLPCGH